VRDSELTTRKNLRSTPADSVEYSCNVISVIVN